MSTEAGVTNFGDSVAAFLFILHDVAAYVKCIIDEDDVTFSLTWEYFFLVREYFLSGVAV